MFETYVVDLFRLRSPEQKNRIERLDFLRGCAIMLVLLHHSGIPNGNWILAFHMPLLFFLSGYSSGCLGKKDGSFYTFFLNRFRRLVIPYYLFEGLNFAVWEISLILQRSWQDVPDALYAVFTCQNTDAYTGYYGRLWFLPCMFVCDILVYGVKRLCHARRGRMLLCSFALLAASWYSANHLPIRLPFASDSALFAAVFFLWGYLLTPVVSKLLESRKLLLDLLVGAGAFGVLRYCIVVKWANCFMYINQYTPFFWTVLAGFSGSVLFLILAKWLGGTIGKISAVKNFILWYGYNSLAVFPIHLSIKIWLVSRYGWGMSWQWLLLAMLVFTIPLVNMVRIWFPFMLGDFSRILRFLRSKIPSLSA